MLATVRAITDASSTDTPAHSTQVGVVAKLISTPHCKEITGEDFYRLVCPQVMFILFYLVVCKVFFGSITKKEY